MSNFDRCPRCNGSWKPWLAKASFECINCKMRLTSRNELILPSPIKEHTNLIWFTDKKICVYGDGYSVVVTGKVTYLPWLPFDISIEKLKTYLTFL